MAGTLFKSFTAAPCEPLSKILSFKVQFNGLVCLVEGREKTMRGFKLGIKVYGAGNG